MCRCCETAIFRKALRQSHSTTSLNIVRRETGLGFAKMLEHAGVFTRTVEGKAAFLRFLTTV